MSIICQCKTCVHVYDFLPLCFCHVFIANGQGCSRQLFIICSVNLANTYFCPLIVDRNCIRIFINCNVFSGCSNNLAILYFKSKFGCYSVSIWSNCFRKNILAIWNTFQICTFVFQCFPSNHVSALINNRCTSQLNVTQIHCLSICRHQFHYCTWQVDLAGILCINVILVNHNLCTCDCIANCKAGITFCSIIIEVAICCILVSSILQSCTCGSSYLCNCSVGQRKGDCTGYNSISISIGCGSEVAAGFCQGVIAIRQSLDDSICIGRCPLNTDLLVIFIQNSGAVCQCNLAPIDIIFRGQGQGCTCNFRLLCDVILADGNRRFLRVVSSQLGSVTACIIAVVDNINIFSRVIRQNDLTVCVDSERNRCHGSITSRSGGFYQNIFRIFYEICSDFVCNVFFNCSQSRFLSVQVCFICSLGIDCKFCTCQSRTVLVCKVFLDQCPCNSDSLVGNGNCTSRSSVETTIQLNRAVNFCTVRTIYTIINGIIAVCTI